MVYPCAAKPKPSDERTIQAIPLIATARKESHGALRPRQNFNNGPKGYIHESL
jgi:hypothetical protein